MRTEFPHHRPPRTTRSHRTGKNAPNSPCVISIVVPAYNELARLPAYLDRIRTHCQAAFDGAYEIVVVDDGSGDGLGGWLDRAAGDWNQLTVVHHVANLGKGAAVRTGMARGRGGLLLFADADGATPIDQEAKLRAAIERGADMAVGSRVEHSDESNVRRSWRGAVQGWAFRQLVHRSLEMPIQDTQCGFKMFRREVGKELFAVCDEAGYLFDLFVLRLAARFGYSIAEVPVEWRDVAGSKVRPVRDPLAMWRGLRQLDERVAEAMRKRASLNASQRKNESSFVV
jgi:dolichyl-phosphate beta-glucosyltransferase